MPKIKPFQVIDGYASFLDLLDTPISYTGNAGKTVLITVTEDGIEFTLVE
jgi:hypothetical protein